MDAVCTNVFLKEIPDNIMLETLPPYSPDLNPSENMWNEIRETFFHNITFNSIKAVESKLIEASNFYENNSKIVQSITAWEWILSAA